MQRSHGKRIYTQAEYSTDLVFRSPTTLKPLYEQLGRKAVLAVKAEQVASFLGKKITAPLAQEIGSRFATRIEGTCIKHRFGKIGVKMYDKFGCALRLETTTNDVSFFKHHRKVEHRDRHATRELALLKKSIYSLIDLREIVLGCNRRYLEWSSCPWSGMPPAVSATWHDWASRNKDGERTIKGLNFFQRTEQRLLRALQRPEFNIHGMRRADLKRYVSELSDWALSRQHASHASAWLD